MIGYKWIINIFRYSVVPMHRRLFKAAWNPFNWKSKIVTFSDNKPTKKWMPHKKNLQMSPVFFGVQRSNKYWRNIFYSIIEKFLACAHIFFQFQFLSANICLWPIKEIFKKIPKVNSMNLNQKNWQISKWFMALRKLKALHGVFHGEFAKPTST